MSGPRLTRTGPRWAVLAALALLLEVGRACASQGPGVADGSAEPMTRAVAAALALAPPVAVAVFALARLLEARR